MHFTFYDLTLLQRAGNTSKMLDEWGKFIFETANLLQISESALH